MYKLILVLSTALSVFAQDEITCKDNNPCLCETDKGLINLQPLGNTDHTFKFESANEEFDNVSISYNPCYQATSTRDANLPNEECIDVAACLHDVNRTVEDNSTETFQFRMALQQETKIVGTKDNKFTITYAGPNEGRKRLLRVDLECNTKAIDPVLEFVEFIGMDSVDDPNTTIEVQLKLTSICGCLDGCPISNPPHKKKGISTGSILVILFFVALLLYVLGGVVYNKIVGGVSGVELLPHIEFWTAFPLLVIDGVRFACNCCRTKRIGSAYDNM